MTGAAHSTPHYPFSALLGHESLRRALLLLAVDPRIGGVLIQGPRGTAKSTSARALADLLPAGSFVNLPLGATEEMLIGTLNIETVLQAGSVRFAPGLLAKAHGGVLYVDEVNLLPDSLVDPLLDVAASGVNVIERDSISHEHAARFALIGTMNPEEGELRPQLLDRFGLSVLLESCADPQLRVEIVQSRLAFDEDPVSFLASQANHQTLLRQRIVRARALLPNIAASGAAHARVSERCIEAQVEGMRADLVMLRAAKALAAWQSDETVSPAHVDEVAELALGHRRRTGQGQSAQSGSAPQFPRDAAARADDQLRESQPPQMAHASPSDAKQEPKQLPENARADGPEGLREASWGELPPPPLAAIAARPLHTRAQKKR